MAETALQIALAQTKYKLEEQLEDLRDENQRAIANVQKASRALEAAEQKLEENNDKARKIREELAEVGRAVGWLDSQQP